MNNNLTTDEQLLVNSEVEKRGKNIVIAYLLCLFLGPIGAHRYYLGRTGSAVAMTLLSITFFGLAITGIWYIIDLFLIPGIVKEDHNKIEQETVTAVLSRREK